VRAGFRVVVLVVVARVDCPELVVSAIDRSHLLRFVVDSSSVALRFIEHMFVNHHEGPVTAGSKRSAWYAPIPEAGPRST
jgi:hypothetical protein